MQFSVCEEMYFESNNAITVGAIRVKFSAIFLFFPSFSLPFFYRAFVGPIFRHDHARRIYICIRDGEHVAC